MTKLKQWIFAFALASASAFAQDLTGTWQGTLQSDRELRVVFKVSKANAGGLTALMYSIDQNGQGFRASAVTLQDSTVRMLIPGVDGAYEGRLSASGNSMAGNWTQGAKPLPLNLTRVTDDAAWVIPEAPAPPKPMAADADPVFAVATVKPSKPDAHGKGISVRGRRFSTFNTSLLDLIAFAYEIHARQIPGAPAWAESDHYDLVAEPDGEGQPSEKQWKIMLQKLLADRFQLTFHRDKKELSVYALTVGKTGPKLTPSEGSPDGLPSTQFRKVGDLAVRNVTMGDFASSMQRAVLDRPVVDHTGLAGRFDFTLTWTADEFQFSGLGIPVPTPTNSDGAPPDLFTAIQQQLGLKLEATKAQTEVLAIDHVEKPSEN